MDSSTRVRGDAAAVNAAIDEVMESEQGGTMILGEGTFTGGANFNDALSPSNNCRVTRNDGSQDDTEQVAGRWIHGSNMQEGVQGDQEFAPLSTTSSDFYSEGSSRSASDGASDGASESDGNRADNEVRAVSLIQGQSQHPAQMGVINNEGDVPERTRRRSASGGSENAQCNPQRVVGSKKTRRRSRSHDGDLLRREFGTPYKLKVGEASPPVSSDVGGEDSDLTGGLSSARGSGQEGGDALALGRDQKQASFRGGADQSKVASKSESSRPVLPILMSESRRITLQVLRGYTMCALAALLCPANAIGTVVLLAFRVSVISFSGAAIVAPAVKGMEGDQNGRIVVKSKIVMLVVTKMMDAMYFVGTPITKLLKGVTKYMRHDTVNIPLHAYALWTIPALLFPGTPAALLVAAKVVSILHSCYEITNAIQNTRASIQ